MMRALRLAIVLATIAVVLCLWLLVGVHWYNFVVFMVIAQPLLVVAVLIFVVIVVRELRQTGVL